jgi:cardiolipin synthase
MRNLPNLITVLRLLAAPVSGYFAAREDFAVALPIFLVAALSDFVDGYLARRLGVSSTFGATLDPVADKLIMLVASVALAWHGHLPLWLAATIVGRDILIVVGVLTYRRLFGALDMKPSRLSKVNTLCEFAMLLVVMATAAGWIDARRILPALFAVVFATLIASGAQYSWIGARSALATRRR